MVYFSRRGTVAHPRRRHPIRDRGSDKPKEKDVQPSPAPTDRRLRAPDLVRENVPGKKMRPQKFRKPRFWGQKIRESPKTGLCADGLKCATESYNKITIYSVYTY